MLLYVFIHLKDILNYWLIKKHFLYTVSKVKIHLPKKVIGVLI